MAIDTWRTLDGRGWLLGIVVGGALGAALAFSVELAVGALVVLVGATAFARSRHRSESLVGVYWVAFALYSIVFYGVTVRFGFYPFYAAFAASFVFALLRGGVRIDPVLAWLYVAFMATVLGSFVGYIDPIDSSVFQRILAYVVGALVVVQFRSVGGLRPVAVGAIIASLSVALFVVFQSLQTGFGYRGGLEANPNAAAMVVALGAVTAIAWLIERWGEEGRAGTIVVLVLVLAVMVYSILLLASRGLTISLVVAFTTMLARAVLRDRRKLGIIVPILVLAGVGLALPGGQNLIERFTSPDENLVTAGSRVPIWTVTIENIVAGNVGELLAGHGFASSEDVVERRFAGQPSTHSTYLLVLYEYGAFSLALFVALLGSLLWRSWRIEGKYGLILLGMTTLLALENVTGDVANGFAFWIAFGYLAAIATWAPTSQASNEGAPRTPPVEDVGRPMRSVTRPVGHRG